MIAEELKQFSVSNLTKSNIILVISVVLMKVRKELLKLHVFHVRNEFGPNSTQKLAQELRFTLNLINDLSP
jgi:hypothetical protein